MCTYPFHSVQELLPIVIEFNTSKIHNRDFREKIKHTTSSYFTCAEELMTTVAVNVTHKTLPFDTKDYGNLSEIQGYK